MSTLPDLLKESDCIKLNLRDQVFCQKCQIYRDSLRLYPNKARRSRCLRPWEFGKEGSKNAHSRTNARVANAWVDILQNDSFALYTIPPDVRLAAKKAGVLLKPKRTTNRQNCRKDPFFSPRKTPIEQKNRVKRTRGSTFFEAQALKLSDRFNDLEVNKTVNTVSDSTPSQAGEATIEISHVEKKVNDLEREVAKLKLENQALKSERQELEKYFTNLANNQNEEQVCSRFKSTIDKRWLGKVEKKLSIYRDFVKKFKKKKYSSQDKFARRLLGEVLSLHPSVSFENTEEIVSIARTQLLAETGFLTSGELSFSDIIKSSPSDFTFRTILSETTADVLFLMHYDIFYKDVVHPGTHPALFLSCDKAPSGSLVKIITWFSISSQKVQQKILDVDKSIEDSQECANAM